MTEPMTDPQPEQPIEWIPIACWKADELRQGLTVISGKTDLSGEFGKAEIFTEWGTEDGVPVMKESRWPDPGDHARPDVEPCQHWRAGDRS